MSERESELIERLMKGDMDAFDELIPNATTELREMVEKALKEMPKT